MAGGGLRKVNGAKSGLRYVKSRYSSFKVARASFKPEAVTLSEESWLLAKGLDPLGLMGVSFGLAPLLQL